MWPYSHSVLSIFGGGHVHTQGKLPRPTARARLGLGTRDRARDMG